MSMPIRGAHMLLIQQITTLVSQLWFLVVINAELQPYIYDLYVTTVDGDHGYNSTCVHHRGDKYA